MKTFQFLLHTTGILLKFEGDPGPAIGFYTNRRAKGSTYQEAFETAMGEFDSDPKITDIVQSGHDAGLRPKTEIEEYYIIPWYKAILPWKTPGLVFYDNEDDAA